jgi:hypothetical protein
MAGKISGVVLGCLVSLAGLGCESKPILETGAPEGASAEADSTAQTT